MKKTPIIKNGLLSFLTAYLFLSPFQSFKMNARTPNEKEAYTEVSPVQSTISGIVTDALGQPVSGVTIQVGGTNVGTISEFDGSYSIQAASDAVLIFSAIGYKTETVPINGRQEIDLTLQEDITQLDEVVLNAGYYTVTEKERTGNISKVTAVDIEKQPISNPLAALQGRMAGVEIEQTSGLPGSNFSIRIRGRNSIRAGGNEPLYIIDGVPFSSSSLGEQQASVALPGGAVSPLNNINPTDIKSIEILKDADATAIYGSRGANGVVLITTKKGAIGKTKLEFNILTGLGKVTNTMNLLKTADYLEMRREAYANEGIDSFPANAYDVNGVWDQNRYIDWQNELFGKSAYLTNFQGSLSSGNEQTSFLLSGNYNGQTTVFPGDHKNDKISVLSNLNHQTKDGKLSLQLSTNYISNLNDLPPSDYLVLQAFNLAPNAPEPFTENGAFNWEGSTWNNPLPHLGRTYVSKASTLISNARVGYKILKELELTTNIGFTQSHLSELRTTPSTIFDPIYGVGPIFSSAIHNTGKRSSWILEPQLHWDHTFNKTKIQVLTGLTFQERTSTRLSQSASGFTSNNFIESLSAASTLTTLADTRNEYRYNAAFARINLNHKKRYIVNFTGRRDGSSRFGPDRRFANFGAIGAAWIFSEEGFIKNGIPGISFGKLRGSYGSTGNDQIGDYQYLDTYSLSPNQYEGINGIFPSRLYNPDFSWETNKKMEFSVELGLFQDRILMTGSYYRNRSSNQLVGFPLPGTTGFSSINANLNATVENTGWEFELNTVNVRTDNFNWSTSLNVTVPKNRLVSFPNLEGSPYANSLVIGESLNIRKVYQLNGVDPVTGIYQFEDFNGDGSISSVDDRQAIRNLDPTFFGGLNNSFSVGKFQLDFLFQFTKQLGRNFWSSGGQIVGAMANQPQTVTERWQQEGDETSVQLYATGSSQEPRRAFSNYTLSDASISDASFVRLRTVNLSYKLAQNGKDGFGCQLFVNGQNLWTLTDYLGLDPENKNSQTIPPLKLISLGLRLTL